MSRRMSKPIAVDPSVTERSKMTTSRIASRFGRPRALGFLIAALLLLAAVAPPAATADFGFTRFDVAFTEEDGSAARQAGSHPDSVITRFELNNTETAPFNWSLDGELKDLVIDLPDGLVGDVDAVPTCSSEDFFAQDLTSLGIGRPLCPDNTAVGISASSVNAPVLFAPGSVFSLEPPPGVPMRIGFWALNAKVIIDFGVEKGGGGSGGYHVRTTLKNVTQAVKVFSGEVILWGNPADPKHDLYRGTCLTPQFSFFAITYGSEGICKSGLENHPLITLPRSCAGPVPIAYQADPWDRPGAWISDSFLTHDNGEPSNPIGFTGCGKLGFKPSIETVPTTNEAETGSGLDFNLDFEQEGLTNPTGLAESEPKSAKVVMPEGFTINPAFAEGLAFCTPADLDREQLNSQPGEGCPNASKIGTLQVETPLFDQPIEGSVFVAAQDDPATTQPGAENPFDSLIALHLVLRNTQRGLLVKLPMKVEPDPATGRLVASMDDIPQLPFTHFNFHFREGARAPLITPPSCGVHTTRAVFTPWSDPSKPRTVVSTFEIDRGVAGGPCPPAGVPPFDPEFEAGSVNNSAGSFSPFVLRLHRGDGDQEMTRFSAVLPPGLAGKLAGVPKCPDGAIEAAKSKTGRQELAAPSCPASSAIGTTLAGTGVGGSLTYVPGRMYLGGPYKGAPLSVVAITPALAGPFDVGTVAVRLALDLNPKTAEVEVDSVASDPIPHILRGIVLKLREVRVDIDRPKFTINPTSCEEERVRATVYGSFLNLLDPLDDEPAGVSTRYQASSCASLGFKPKLSLRLRGGTGRGANPALVATYAPRSGDANVQDVAVQLPHSAFLDQGHIRTVCTRVQFAADSCPKAARYGFAKAWTPLLDEPLAGPVYLRSSSHPLPDMVFDLHGLVDVEVAARIDSVDGAIRATVEDAPDAPLSKFVLRMQGRRKGLIVNSRDLCASRGRAKTAFAGHNGKRLVARPVVGADCGTPKRERHPR